MLAVLVAATALTCAGFNAVRDGSLAEDRRGQWGPENRADALRNYGRQTPASTVLALVMAVRTICEKAPSTSFSKAARNGALLTPSE
jgi:hypothetical protein